MRRKQHRQSAVWAIMMLLLPMLLVISDEAGPELLPGVEAAVNCSISEDDTAPAWNITVEKNDLKNSGLGNGYEEKFDDDPGGMGEFNLNRLTSSFHTSFLIENDSAVSLRMNMTTGYKYTFCIDLQPVVGEPNQNSPIADVYLIQEYDYSRYKFDYDSRHNDWDGLRDEIAHAPPLIQNAIIWQPFRDVHAYEEVDEVEFSVALDHPEQVSTEEIWSEGEVVPRTMFLIVDAWDNIRDYDVGAANRNITADVTVMVEERFALPNWTVAVVCCGSLLAILAAPFLIHFRYMKAGAPETSSADLMPHLETEAENDGMAITPFEEGPPSTQLNHSYSSKSHAVRKSLIFTIPRWKRE